MSSIRKIPRGNGSAYVARWRDPDGRQRKKTFAKQGDAKRHLAVIDADLARGVYVDIHNRATVAEYARSWAANQHHRPNTKIRVESLIRCHLDGTRLGSRPIARVTPSEAQSWATGRAAVLAPSSVRLVVKTVSAIFAAAVADHIRAENPLDRVRLAAPKKAAPTALSLEQVAALIEATREPYRTAVLLQAQTGMRVGELLATRLDTLNLLRRELRVTDQVDPRTRELVDLKTESSHRTLPLATESCEALARYLATHQPGPSGLLFCAQGRPWSRAAYGAALAQAGVRAGLDTSVTSHSLRHHFASLLLEHGQSVVAVARLLGHDDNGATLLRTYAHVIADNEDRVRRVIDSIWRALDVPAATDATR